MNAAQITRGLSGAVISILLGLAVSALAITLIVTPVSGTGPQGTAITVNTTVDVLGGGDGKCSLREAVQAANTDSAVDACPAGSGHDTIILAAGSYTLTLTGAGEDDNATGDLDVLTDSLTISGAGSGSTIIDGNQTDRVLQVHDVALEIVGITVVNGKTPDWTPGSVIGGGGIHSSGPLTVSHSMVSSNTTGANGGDGGGIYSSGTLLVSHSTISDNVTGHGFTGGYGGGIYGSGTVAITDSMVSGNTTGPGGSGAYGGPGGGIYNAGRLSIGNSTVSNNRTGDSQLGGGFGDGGDGGGIFNAGLLSINSSVVSGNVTGKASSITGHGGNGGGLYNQSTLILGNSTVSGNTAGDGVFGGGNGGGIYNNSSGVLTVTNTTVASNTVDGDSDGSGNGGGVYRASGTVNIRNTIVANNVDKGGEAPDCSGTLTSYGYNSVEITATCTISPAADAGTDIIGQDPSLGPLASNGGSTWTHALLSGSPAIDAGSCTLIDGVTPVGPDQRGVARPQGKACDMGAYEAQPVLSLTKTVDDGTVWRGQRVTYTVAVSNTGSLTATAVRISDTLPADLLLAGPATLTPPQAAAVLAAVQGDFPNLASNVTIAPGQRVIVTFAATIGVGPDGAGHIITNTASVTSSDVISPVWDSAGMNIVAGTSYLPVVLRQSS